MHLKVRGDWLCSLSKVWKENAVWHREGQWLENGIEEFSEEELDKLVKIAEANKDVKGSVAIVQKIKMYRSLKSDVKSVKINRLEAIVDAMKLLMKGLPNKWLFTENADGHLVPWYVFNVTYEPPDPRNQSPAASTIQMAAVMRGETITKTMLFDTEDIHQGTMLEMLEKRGFFLESDEVLAQYRKEVAYYKEVSGKTGEQYFAYGSGYDLGDSYRSDLQMMERDGDPATVVMDDIDPEGSRSHDHNRRDRVTGAYWSETTKRSGEDDNEIIVRLPLQPYVKIFVLAEHKFMRIHACDLKAYPWDATLIDKLVLPEEHKELVHMLVTGADLVMEDIIKGKTGGIIVITTGDPGVGKTLTAEVVSECVKKPLYKVQCSQLGTDEVALEKQLKIVLSRAERWKALLLIDEADVYVHERGEDIQQNAIVGVFLRIMEYYRGILFLTSNRATIIDDAILSRATAWIRYLIPEKEALRKIWAVLTHQYQVPLKPAELEELVTMPEFTGISGRSVKSLLKLARLLTIRKKERVTPKMLKYVSQFIDIESSKEHVQRHHSSEQRRAAAAALRLA